MSTKTATKTTTAREQREAALSEPFATKTTPRSRKRQTVTDLPAPEPESLPEVPTTPESTETPERDPHLADTSQLVNLETGEPIPDQEVLPVEETPTPKTTSYAIVLSVQECAGIRDETLATVTTVRDAYEALVTQAKALSSRGYSARGDRMTGYAVLQDNLVVGHLCITDAATGERALTETPKSRRSVIVAAKASAMTTAFQNYLNHPMIENERTLLSQMKIYEQAIRDLGSGSLPEPTA